MSSSELVQALRRAGVDDVLDDTVHRAAYSSDASLYRVVPAAVVRPHDSDDVVAVLETCSEAKIPVTCRGAGTSIAGNAVGSGVVLDFSRYMHAIVQVDAESRLATVQPGTVHAQLQRGLGGLGLRFGPDPSTHSRCTIGGMIGNNACGSRALGYGRTVDNVAALDVITAGGRRLRLDSPEAAGAPEIDMLAQLTGELLPAVRGEFGRFGRQVSGYGLEHLSPENGFDVRRALVGSEGTLAVVVGATIKLVEVARHAVLLVLGFADMASAADAAPSLLDLAPTACEGFDARLIEVVRARQGEAAVPPLPRGSGWLFVEFVADTLDAALAAAKTAVVRSGALDSAVVSDAGHVAALWRIREDGAGLAGRTSTGAPAYPGWEDSAVPPEVLGAYVRDLDALLENYGLTGVPYGHFGSGCVHLRLDFPFDHADGRAVLRSFLFDAGRLVASYGGSLSGEHGDGRARSELLPLMYSPAAIELFARVKHVFDPDNLLNPGVLVAPSPLDADVRATGQTTLRGSLALALRSDDGDFGAAVHRCTGIGSCRADSTASGGVMCPSFLATRDERDSTRGRARVLQEMVRGTLVEGGWRAPEVHEALDLCLSCKACSTECPAGVDMASYKSEVLYQAYRGRLRPRSHYALGQLPRWVRLGARTPRLANAVLGRPLLSRALRYGAGVDRRRDLPRIAEQSFGSWFAATSASRRTGGAPVVLLADTFTNYFSPEVGIAAVRVLEHAGFSVSLPARATCCGLTWITTGQLDAARRILGRTVATLEGAAKAGVPIVGLEPSCTAALRSDAPELVGTEAAEAVAGGVRTLAEILTSAPQWRAPRLDGVEVVAQPHCHQRAVMGWAGDELLLRAAGAQLSSVGGCCGLAGNFGVERGHYDVSVAIAENALLPAVRSAGPDAVLLADGFSCRTQLGDLAGRTGVHLAQLLAGALDGSGPGTGAS